MQPGDMVLGDQLSAHKGTGVAELLAARGAPLSQLSPSSPDCNPIEQWWSQITTCLRRAKAQTV